MSRSVAVLLFNGITALDAVGPYEVLSRLPDTTVTFVGLERGSVRTDNGMLSLVADAAIDEVTAADVLLIPGGSGTRALWRDPVVHAWVRAVDVSTTWTTSVCTGSLILGGAGLLEGLRATTHWLARDLLARTGAVVVADRVVRQGKIVTAAGVSSGIDMALRLASWECGDEVAQEIQLMIEYDPQPPFSAGSPESAPAAIVARLRAGAAG